jgi:GNAT superfamily N-acetyltransferase
MVRMVDANTLIKASLEAGREFFTPPHAGGDETAGAPGSASTTPAAAAPKSAPYLVPIRSLGPAHCARIRAHLLALSEHDRYLRFGFAATDEHVSRYADGLDFERDEIFGVYNRKLELLAVAHLARPAEALGSQSCKNCAEFGVSVAASARGRGLGTRLFERALMHARNAGVDMLFIHALSENTAMLKIAQKAGALVERNGSETEAYVLLPKADFDSRMTEFIEEQIAQTDYALKTQANQFWEVLRGLQAVRQGLQEALSGEVSK